MQEQVSATREQNLMHSPYHRTSLISGFARFAAAAFLTSCAAGALAQQPDTASKLSTLDLSHPAQSLQASLKAPFALSSGEAYSSSSNNAEALAKPSAEAENAPASDLQPPPRRRRYGRPNYRDKYRNADGSNRFAFVAGAGFNVPIGDASANYLTTGYRFEAGAGVNMNKKLGVLFQFAYDPFGIPSNILQNQANLYTQLSINAGTPTDYTGLGGNAHIWSFTLNPTLNFYQGEKVGAYAVVGGGFYHKITNFTIPTTGQYCDYYYGCYTYQANQTIDNYTSNAPGVTGGVGLTYKFSRWSNERLFAEARYVHTFNQARLGDPSTTGASTGTFNNFYPPNSNETSYIPITFGIRF